MPLASAALSSSFIVALWPLLREYALARPTARSSHAVPTPQGGGAAVIAATLAVATAAQVLEVLPSVPLQSAIIYTAAAVLALVGAIDDIRPLSVSLRFALQGLAAAAVMSVAIGAGRVLGPSFPDTLEFALAVLATLWFVNLTNFMDGLDWMTVAIVSPMCAAIAVAGMLGEVAAVPLGLALSLLGALVGFAPFNKPVARLFLGDVGSLPIGLLLSYLLYALASGGHLAAAIILPLYPVADATITLLRRALAGEKVWVAHRTHFYQRATDNGFSVIGVSARVFILQIALACLAGATIIWPSIHVVTVALILATVLVGFVLLRFARVEIRITRR